VSLRRASTWRFTAGGIALLLFALALVVGWSAGSLDRALDAFSDDGSDAGAPVARPANAKAWAIHRLAAGMVVQGVRPQGASPVPEKELTWGALPGAQAAWLADYRYLWRASDPRDAPPAPDELHAWLGSQVATYEALVDLLIRDEMPDWGSDPASRIVSEVPVGAGILQRLMLGRALDNAARGDRAEAERTLLAAWRLEEGMRSGSEAAAWSVDFNSQSVSILRHVRPSDALAWIARLDALHPRRDLDGHLRWAARRVVVTAAESEARVPRWLPRVVTAHLIALVDAPVRLRATRSIAALADVSSELRRLPPCGDPALVLHAPVGAGVDSILEDATQRPRPPGLEYDFARLRQLEVDIALTRRVLALDAGIDEPPRPEGACADPPVTQALGADGQWTVGWGDVTLPAGSALRDVVDALMGESPPPPRVPPSFTFRPRVAAEAPVLASAPRAGPP
jgi:hypothetical protein